MFWNNLCRLCNENQTTPNAICKALGLSSATATHWKAGAIPRDTTLHRIADYFGITVEDLLRDPSEAQTAPAQAATDPDPVLDEFTQLLDQLTVKELRELKAFMLEKINSRK